ncbi:MAG: hypothetical protein AB7O56_07520 [Bauldia sp.]
MKKLLISLVPLAIVVTVLLGVPVLASAIDPVLTAREHGEYFERILAIGWEEMFRHDRDALAAAPPLGTPVDVGRIGRGTAEFHAQ